MKSNIKFSSLKFEQFEKAHLSQNQLRSVIGGKDTTTTYTESPSGRKGSDTNHNDGTSTFDDGTEGKEAHAPGNLSQSRDGSGITGEPI